MHAVGHLCLGFHLIAKAYDYLCITLASSSYYYYFICQPTIPRLIRMRSPVMRGRVLRMPAHPTSTLLPHRRELTGSRFPERTVEEASAAKLNINNNIVGATRACFLSMYL